MSCANEGAQDSPNESVRRSRKSEMRTAESPKKVCDRQEVRPARAIALP